MRLVLFIAFALSFSKIYATDTTTTWSQIAKSFRKEEINVKNIRPQIGQKVLKKLEVTDLRVDKDRLGLFADNYHRPYEITLKAPETIETIFTQKLCDEKSEGEDALLVTQDFWLTGGKPEIIIKEGKKPVINTFKIVAKLDVFVKQGNSYVPLTRIDTTIWGKNSNTNDEENLITRFIEVINEEIANEIHTKNFLNRKKVDKQFLQNYYSKKIASFEISDLNVNKGI